MQWMLDNRDAILGSVVGSALFAALKWSGQSVLRRALRLPGTIHVALFLNLLLLFLLVEAAIGLFDAVTGTTPNLTVQVLAGLGVLGLWALFTSFFGGATAEE
ncbi:MAG: hypothetical protein KGK34_08725 [Chloroflexota bacterium]|nr:hypothetical protein [Chloroflexota bacterium]